jgi:hypothetical protein
VSSGRKRKKKKKEKSGIENGSVDGKTGNAPDTGGSRRRRRFQTSKPWLLFLAFSSAHT